MLLLLLPLLIQPAHLEATDCVPGFADSCFSSVQGDLTLMMNFRLRKVMNVTQAALIDLCTSLDDALNCTTDVIDEDCSDDEGRNAFDSWVAALRAPYGYVCGGHQEKLKDILEGIRCWDINRFFLCTEAKAGVGHIRDLLHSPFVKEECDELTKDIEYCRKDAEVSSCREQDNIVAAVKGMIEVFINQTHCMDKQRGNGADKVEPIKERGSGASREMVATLSTVLFLIIMVVSIV